MNGTEAQLNDLQNALEKTNKEFNAARGTLQEAQKKLGEADSRRNELTAMITSLKSQIGELHTIRTAIQDQRAVAEREINDTAKTADELAKKLAAETSEGLRKAVETAVKTVDDKIQGKQTAVAELQAKLSQVEKDFGDAQSQVSNTQSALSETKGELNTLANQIKSSRAQLINIKSGAELAYKNKRLVEAVYLVGQVQQAITRLRALVDPKSEDQLVNKLAEQDKKANAARETLAKKSGERDQIRGDLKAAQQEYLVLVSEREKTIAEQLNAIAKNAKQYKEKE